MLFGHQNDDTGQSAVNAPVAPVPGVNPLAVDPDTGASLPVAPAEPPMPPEPSEPSVLNQPVAPLTDTTPALDPPVSTDLPQADATLPLSAPAVQPPAEEASPFSALPDPIIDSVPLPPASEVDQSPVVVPPQPSRPDPSLDSNTSTDLLGLKQQALAQLEPLVDQLDQTPEEKFRTTMMLIQSTDNQALIQHAYDAAQAIGDEKVRAQALLDVINEINYFTQQQPKE